MKTLKKTGKKKGGKKGGGKKRGRKRRRETQGVREKSKKSFLGKACHKGAKPTWNSYQQTLLLTLDSHPHLKGENHKRKVRGWPCQKGIKREKRGKKKTYLRSLVCSFGQKWWEEKAWRSREVWGRKRWKRRNSSRSKLYKTSPRVSGGRTVIPAEQVRTDLFRPLQETQTWGRTDVLRLF